MNIDFVRHQEAATARLEVMQQGYVVSESPGTIRLHRIEFAECGFFASIQAIEDNFPIILMTLVHRSFVKSYRDIVAYGIRVAMYTGLAIMMGTVWLRLQDRSSSC